MVDIGGVHCCDESPMPGSCPEHHCADLQLRQITTAGLQFVQMLSVSLETTLSVLCDGRKFGPFRDHGEQRTYVANLPSSGCC